MTREETQFYFDNYIRKGPNAITSLKDFATAVRPYLNPGEIWRLSTNGYDTVKNGRFLTHSKKKEQHPNLHYGRITTLTDFDMVTEDSLHRLDMIDRLIDSNLRAYKANTPGQSKFGAPINAIQKFESKIPKTFIVGEYRVNRKNGSYINYKFKVVTDGDIMLHKMENSAFSEYNMAYAFIEDFTYLYTIELVKDNKNYLLDSLIVLRII